MNWLNLRTEILHSPEFIGCHPTRRATWLSLSLWCASQENGGIVTGGAKWSDRQWQQTCGVTKDEATDSCELFRVDGGNVVLWGYPVEKQAEVQERRELARENGRRGGRPLKKQPEEPTPVPTLVSENNQHRYQHPKAEGEGERNENENENEKGVQGAEAGPASPPASTTVELSLTSEPPAQPAKTKRAPKQPTQTDAEWLASLAASPAYAGIDVAREHAKAGIWHADRKRALTRRSFINWLNRADKPLQPTNGQHRQGFDHRNIATHPDREQLRTFTH